MPNYEEYKEFEAAANEIDERSGNANDENCIESDDDSNIMYYAPNVKKTMTCFFTRKRWVNKVMECAAKYPDEVTIKCINKDGSIIAQLPADYLHIYRPRELSEETKEKCRKNLAKAQQN